MTELITSLSDIDLTGIVLFDSLVPISHYFQGEGNMRIYFSRHQPGVSADKIRLNKGETVLYLLKNGSKEKIIIDSEPMSHDDCDSHGYESIFSDGRFFADSKRILDWEGKC